MIVFKTCPKISPKNISSVMEFWWAKKQMINFWGQIKYVVKSKKHYGSLLPHGVTVRILLICKMFQILLLIIRLKPTAADLHN